jgi:hypothetical protein
MGELGPMSHARTNLAILREGERGGHDIDPDDLRDEQVAALRELREIVADLREDMPDALDAELADIEAVLEACAEVLEHDEISQGAINERALGGEQA